MYTVRKEEVRRLSMKFVRGCSHYTKEIHWYVMKNGEYYNADSYGIITGIIKYGWDKKGVYFLKKKDALVYIERLKENENNLS